MGKTLRLVTDVLTGFSVTAWISGPLMEIFAIQPAIEKAEDKAQAEAILGSAYKAYSNVVHIGLAGLAVANLLKIFGDDLRKPGKGTKGYRLLARLGDLQVLGVILLGGATRMISKKLKNLDPNSAEVESGKANLKRISRASVGLSVGLLINSAFLYRARAESLAKQASSEG